MCGYCLTVFPDRLSCLSDVHVVSVKCRCRCPAAPVSPVVPIGHLCLTCHPVSLLASLTCPLPLLPPENVNEYLSPLSVPPVTLSPLPSILSSFLSPCRPACHPVIPPVTLSSRLSPSRPSSPPRERQRVPAPVD